jgi:eukaryotic-like serine/threonine-protein kinase
LDQASDKNFENKRIGKYEVMEVLGRGGMGVVYRAIDKHIGREVAIKTLTQGVAGDPEMLARFYEEGRKTGRLNHPHIVTVYDLGEDNGVPFIVMERVEGDPLDKIIAKDIPLSMMDRLRIIEEMCSALGYAHSNNVIHRDVKPANIFVQPDGKAKLLDFGIARLERRSQDISLTRTGHIIGTVPYMAPERLRDKMIDGRSDIFSIGVVLHQLITGQLPFTGEDYVLMQKILHEAHPPLSNFCVNCPEGLQDIVDRSLEKSMDMRYQTAEEMAADLRSLIEVLGKEQVVELLPEAQRLVEAEEYTRARVVLQQVLKVQSKHTGARELLTEIQRRIVQKQREERLRNARMHAEDALSRREFDQSLQILKEGLEVDPASTTLLSLKELVLGEKKKQEQVDALLRHADSARRKGDLKSALASAQEALDFDKTNSKVLALCNLLAAETEQAERKARARAMMETARRHLDARQFEQAVAVLRSVEVIAPADPEVQALIGDAQTGLEQQRRRERITQLEQQAAMAKTLEQLQEAARSIQEAQTSLPNESALFRLSAQVDRRIKEMEIQRLVEETYQRCRDVRPREAMDLVRAARERLPEDERLLSLERVIKERLHQQTVDERRGEYLSRAREALKEGKYSDALHILEASEAEGVGNAEVRSLMEFARAEEAESTTQNLKRSKLIRAQSLVNEGKYEEAITFLTEALAENEESSLRLLLEQATSAREALQRQVDSALAAAGRLEQAGKPAEALQLLRVLPREVLPASRVQMAIAALEDEQSRALFRMAGRAYGMLASDIPTGHRIMERVAAGAANASVAAVMASTFEGREKASADRALAEAIRRFEVLARNRDAGGMEKLQQETDLLAFLASPERRSEWAEHSSRLSRKALRTRL